MRDLPRVELESEEGRIKRILFAREETFRRGKSVWSFVMSQGGGGGAVSQWVVRSLWKVLNSSSNRWQSADISLLRCKFVSLLLHPPAAIGVLCTICSPSFFGSVSIFSSVFVPAKICAANFAL